MATEEDTQARLDRILIRVQAGEGIKEAVRQEIGGGNCHWFYRRLTVQQRAPIVRAWREYQEMSKHPNGRPEIKGRRSTPHLQIAIPLPKKNALQCVCDEEGVSMSKYVLTLISRDLAKRKAGL